MDRIGARRPLFGVVASAIAISACTASSPRSAPRPADESTAAEAPAPATSARRSRSDRLTAEEIQATRASSVYDAVARLRPQWLNNRGGQYPDPDGSVEVQVWYNGRREGGPAVMRRYDISQIVAMRYVDPITARSSFGPGNGRGVIVVTGR